MKQTVIRCLEGPYKNLNKYHVISILGTGTYAYKSVQFPNLDSAANIICGCSGIRPSDW